MTACPRRIVLIACVLLLAGAATAAAQARDFNAQSKLEPAGTGLVSGTIVTDEAQPRAIRRVVVTITEAASIIQPRVVTSDEEGRFFFRNLPPGRYSVSAARQPYLTGAYGARRVAGPGSVQAGIVIVLGTGQQVTGITITLMRGSVITGTLRDADGQPARGFRVAVFYYQRSPTTGERTLTAYGASSQTSDDRGLYRIYGLPPGTYVVAALPGGATSQTDAAHTTDADIARAMDLLQRPGAPAGVAPTGAAAASGSGTTPSALPRRPTSGYVPVYYPGVVDHSQATTVTLGVAEERPGIDFQLQLASTARIEGTISGLPPKQRVVVRATSAGVGQAPGTTSASSAQSDEQGRFTMSGLVPGSYVVEARMPADDGTTALWARTELTIAGDDRSVSLTLQPAVSFAGRIVFEGTTAKPIDVTRARASLTNAIATTLVTSTFPPGVSPPGAPVPPGTPAANGEFSIPGVVPGRYRLNATFPIPAIESGWYIKSAAINGQDTLDAPVEIRPGESITNAVITMTDRPSEVLGSMTDAAGSPAPEYFIIVFAADEAYWAQGSRRIAQTRPQNDGSFSVRNLPAGDYRIAAVTDVQQGEWFDPEFLKQLVEASVKITLTEHGKVRQDLRIR